jgi:hypothetical protein
VKLVVTDLSTRGSQTRSAGVLVGPAARHHDPFGILICRTGAIVVQVGQILWVILALQVNLEHTFGTSLPLRRQFEAAGFQLFGSRLVKIQCCVLRQYDLGIVIVTSHVFTYAACDTSKQACELVPRPSVTDIDVFVPLQPSADIMIER